MTRPLCRAMQYGQANDGPNAGLSGVFTEWRYAVGEGVKGGGDSG